MRLILVFLTTLFCFSATAENLYPVMKTCDSFLLKRKYYSAFKVLHAYDSTNQHPEILFKKQEIAMHFHLAHDKYQLFSFIDIEPFQVIQSFRNKSYSGEVYTLPFDKLYEQLIKRDPANEKLRGHLIEYYFQCYIEYGEDWIMPSSAIFQNIQREIMYLDDNHKATAYHYYIMGYILMARENAVDAIPFYKKSFEMDAKDGETQYNLGYAFQRLGQADSALKYYKLAIVSYPDTNQKADAARNIAFIYESQGDLYNALIYLEMSEKLEFTNYYTMRSLLNLHAVQRDNREKEYLDRFYLTAPDNKQIYIDLMAIYTHVNRLGALEQYFLKQLVEFRESLLISAHLNFFMAELTKSKDKEKTKAYLNAALQNYKKALPSKHEQIVFVESIIKEYK